ncbi:hypothetical protein BsWGS_16312 [Bradybaena similaris]
MQCLALKHYKLGLNVSIGDVKYEPAVLLLDKSSCLPLLKQFQTVLCELVNCCCVSAVIICKSPTRMKAREIHRRHFKSSVGSVLNEHYDSGVPTAYIGKSALRQSAFPLSNSGVLSDKSNNLKSKHTKSYSTLSPVNALSAEHLSETQPRFSLHGGAEEINQKVSQIASTACPLETKPRYLKLENERRDRMPSRDVAISQPLQGGCLHTSRKPISNNGALENESLCDSKNSQTLYSSQSTAQVVDVHEAETFTPLSKHIGSYQVCLTTQPTANLHKRPTSFSSSPHSLKDMQTNCVSDIQYGAGSIRNKTSHSKYDGHRNKNSSLEQNTCLTPLNLLTSKKDMKSPTKTASNNDLRVCIDWNKIFPHATEEQ